MAIIKVSAQEMKKGLPLDPKWYPADIKEIKLEPSKDKTKINYNLYVMVDDGTEEGREIKQTLMTSDLKGLFESALTTEDDKFEVPLSGYEYDTDMVAGRRINVKFENEAYQGRLIPKIKAFLPGHIDVSTIPF